MKAIYPLMVAALLAAPVAWTGCERMVSETTHTQTDSNGNVSQESKTVKEDANGNVTVQKEKTEKTVNNQ
jgi:hypothetical protein